MSQNKAIAWFVLPRWAWQDPEKMAQVMRAQVPTKLQLSPSEERRCLSNRPELIEQEGCTALTSSAPS